MRRHRQIRKPRKCASICLPMTKRIGSLEGVRRRPTRPKVPDRSLIRSGAHGRWARRAVFIIIFCPEPRGNALNRHGFAEPARAWGQEPSMARFRPFHSPGRWRLSLLSPIAGQHMALDAVTFPGTDWRAEAEHGGYYQAIATGIYEKYGLEVTLRQGGPQVSRYAGALLAAGRPILTRRRTPSAASTSSIRLVPMVVTALLPEGPSV